MKALATRLLPAAPSREAPELPQTKTFDNTDSHPVLATERDAVATALLQLRGAVAAFGSRLPAETRARADDVAARAEQRLRLSAVHTVVSFAGATGSGKSSLFNALAGMGIAQVGVRRPTTSDPYACVWGPKGASELLDWLGLPAASRFARESALDADDQAELRGLVLLDLPDYDSVSAQPSNVVRLIDQVDMLVWVVDPQKYADAATHDYLRSLNGRDALVLVVLNQADTLTEDELQICVEDLRRMLVADGLPDAAVVTTSAVRGDGLTGLRNALVTAVAARVASMRRLRADLDDVAAELAAMVAGEPVELPNAAVGAIRDGLATAAGTATLTRQVAQVQRLAAARWVSWPLARVFRRVTPAVAAAEAADRAASTPAAEGALVVADPAAVGTSVAAAQVTQSVRSVVAGMETVVPNPWAASLRTLVSPMGTRAAEALEREVARVSLRPDGVPLWWRAVSVVQWALLSVLVVASVWLVSVSILEFTNYRTPDLPTAGRVSIPSAVVLFGLAIGPVLALVCRPLVSAAANRARDRVGAELAMAVERVLESEIAQPLRAELSAHTAAVVAVAGMRAAVRGDA